MEKEIFALASRNSALQQEKDDLLMLMDQRDYEAMQLKSHLEMGTTGRMGATSNMYDNLENTLMNNDTGDYIYGQEDVVEDENAPKPPSPERKKTIANLGNINTVRIKAVPDVVKEYLYLTASAVKIKFPKIDTVSSEQLILQVQDLPFSDYYEHMFRIMKNEQLKLDEELAKKNASRKQQMQQQQQQQQQSQGFLAKFRGLFSSTAPSSNPHSHDNNLHPNETVRSTSKSVPSKSPTQQQQQQQQQQPQQQQTLATKDAKNNNKKVSPSPTSNNNNTTTSSRKNDDKNDINALAQQSFKSVGDYIEQQQ